jgi:hypothetical protein
MPTKLENIAAGMELFNVVFPNIAGLIVTLKNGKEIDIKQLLDDTEQFAEGKIQEANDFLNRD